MVSHRCGYISLCTAFLLALAGEPAVAQGNSQVVFLHLKLKQGKLILLDRNVRGGSVKQSRAVQQYATWNYDVRSRSGEVLWSGTMRDPSLRRYEYEDPNEPGKLKGRHVDLDNAEFTVRIPDIVGADRVEFYRSIASSAGAERPVRQLIGTIPLSPGGMQQ